MKSEKHTIEGKSIKVYETTWFLSGFKAKFNLFFISIRDLSDRGLVNHEMMHFRQYLRGRLKFFKMLCDFETILKNEAEAYAVQIKYNTLMSIEDGPSKFTCAAWISSNYSFGLIGKVVAKLFGFRTKRINYDEALSKINYFLEKTYR